MSETLWTGMIADETAEAYHSKREYISSSPLPEMEKSPLHFLKAWTTPVEPTAAMDKGTFLHSVLLYQDINKFVARPVKEDGSLVRSNTKEYAAFVANNPGKIIIDPDLYREASAVLSSACTHAPFMRAFEAGHKECSFYGFHEETGLYLKARADVVGTDFSFLSDVKSTSDIKWFESQIFKLGYDVRLVHYAETIKAATGKEIPESEFYFHAIESSDPYGMKTFQLDAEDVKIAKARWRMWMNEISVCKADDVWPGYDDKIAKARRPKYLSAETEIIFDGVG